MITSRNNAIIKEARSLRQEGRGRRSGALLIEGIHSVGVAIEAGWPIQCLLYSQDVLVSDFGRRLVEKFPGRSEEVSPPVLESVSGKENPQGILAIAQKRAQPLDSLKPLGCSAALVSPQDPGNVGTILRTLDAVGGSALYLLDGGVDPFHPTAVRAAMGACFLIPVVETGFSEFNAWRQTQGLQLIGSSAHAPRDYSEIQPITPWVLLLGSEQKGLSESQRLACDWVARLPMRGRTTSLNLAVAAGILLFEYAEGMPHPWRAR